MRQFISLILIVLVSTSCTFSQTLKEGDIVFQTSTSKQSPLIALATGSVYTHCGIIIEKADGLYVLEAVGPVKLTPFEQWKDRGLFNHVKSRRVIDKPVKIRYNKYLGQPYDWSFKFNNGKMYCSELVYEIYKEQFGITLAQPKKVKEYNIIGMSKVLKKRHIDENQLVISPYDLLSD